MCNRKGWILESGRPQTHLTAAGADLFKAYRVLKEYHQVPAPGPWVQQAAPFVAAVELCDQAATLFRARAAEKEKEMRDIQEQVNRMTGAGL